MYRRPWEKKQCWSYFQADVPSYFFSWNALFQACSRLRGFSDAEANANGKGSSPESDLSSLSCYLFQAPLILLVWGRPRTPQMSRILSTSKEGWKEASCADSGHGAPEHHWGVGWSLAPGHSRVTFLMALPGWHTPLPGSGSLIPPGQLLLDGCSGFCAGSLWHSTQLKLECEELKTGQVLHVSDRREAETTPGSAGLRGCRLSLPRACGREYKYVGVHTWRVAWCGGELSCTVNMEEACMFMCIWVCLWHGCLSACCMLWERWVCVNVHVSCIYPRCK